MEIGPAGLYLIGHTHLHSAQGRKGMNSRRVAVLLLLALAVVQLAIAQQVSQKKDIAVFKLSYYQWDIPDSVLGGIDEELRGVFVNIGRFNVLGMTQRLEPGDLNEFIDKIRQYKQDGRRSPKRCRWAASSSPRRTSTAWSAPSSWWCLPWPATCWRSRTAASSTWPSRPPSASSTWSRARPSPRPSWRPRAPRRAPTGRPAAPWTASPCSSPTRSARSPSSSSRPACWRSGAAR